MRWHLNHLQRYATGFFLTCWVCLYLTPDRTGWPKLAGKQPGINDTYWDKMSWKYVWLRTENCLNSVFCICGSQTHIYVYIYTVHVRHPTTSQENPCEMNHPTSCRHHECSRMRSWEVSDLNRSEDEMEIWQVSLDSSWTNYKRMNYTHWATLKNYIHIYHKYIQIWFWFKHHSSNIFFGPKSPNMNRLIGRVTCRPIPQSNQRCKMLKTFKGLTQDSSFIKDENSYIIQVLTLKMQDDLMQTSITSDFFWLLCWGIYQMWVFTNDGFSSLEDILKLIESV